jgi:hypothetical protein
VQSDYEKGLIGLVIGLLIGLLTKISALGQHTWDTRNAENQRKKAVFHVGKQPFKVEAAGIEPASRDPSTDASTCVVKRLCLHSLLTDDEFRSQPRGLTGGAAY